MLSIETYQSWWAVRICQAINLIVLETKGYEAILGMDWLPHYRANFDCEKCQVTFTRKEGKLVFQGKKKESGIPVISALTAERMVEKGCESFLATIITAGAYQEVLLGKIPMVQEFEDVFQKLVGCRHHGMSHSR